MRLVLYSIPDGGVLEKIEDKIFQKDRKTVLGYMPADGNNPKPNFTPFWQSLAAKHGAIFVYIDNSRKPTKKELEDISSVNSLCIMGGNVFALLHNLRESGLDKVILEKSKEKDFVYSGFSAGAIIVTPDIRIADEKHGWSFGGDKNEDDILDTKALGLVDFEILPHFDVKADSKKLRQYEEKYQTKVKALTDSDFLIIQK